MQADLKPQYFPSSKASFSICRASSRVGARTKARGPSFPFAAGLGLFSINRVNKVIKKAAVLPVPVCACPARSFRDRVMGRDLL